MRSTERRPITTSESRAPMITDTTLFSPNDAAPHVHPTSEPPSPFPLPMDSLAHIFSFLPGHYRYLAGTCHAFRDACNEAATDQNGHNTTTFASAAASVACAELCLGDASESSVINSRIHGIAMAAALGGQSEVFKWACNRSDDRDRLFEEAARCGQLGIHSIAVAAARSGQREVFKGAYKKGDGPVHLFEEAARCGQLEMFEFAESTGCEWDFYGVGFVAAEAGHLNVLEWLWVHRAQRDFKAEREYLANCASLAAKGGHVPVLDWLRIHCRLPFRSNKMCWRKAAENGRVQVLDWLLESGYSLDPHVMDNAARFGQIRVLEWARRHEVGWSSHTCALAALHGHLDTLIWLRNNGCSWDSNVFHWADGNRHKDVVEWAVNNGCPI